MFLQKVLLHIIQLFTFDKNDHSLSLGFLWHLSQPEREPALLPLTPSAELDDDSLAINTRDILKNSNVNTLRRPPNHLDLLGEDTSEDFCMEESADDNSRAFNMNLPAHDLVDNVDDSPVLQNALNSEDLTSFDINFNLHDLTPSSSAPAREGNVMTQDLLISPSSVFLVDKEDVRDEDSLPSQLIDLLDDDAILDEMRLLNLVLEEGFSPEMAAKLEEEGYIECERAKQDSDITDDHSVSTMPFTEDQSEPRIHQQGK